MNLLEDVTCEDVNVIYIYLTGNDINNMTVDLDIPIQRIRRKFKFNVPRSFTVFYMNNISYTYDMSNDSQTCYKSILRKIKKTSYKQGLNLCIHAYEEKKLPCYMFPSTDEISHKECYTIEEYKINNRITLNICSLNGSDTSSYVYIQYKHSSNADIPHNEKCLEGILNKL